MPVISVQNRGTGIFLHCITHSSQLIWHKGIKFRISTFLQRNLLIYSIDLPTILSFNWNQWLWSTQFKSLIDWQHYYILQILFACIYTVAYSWQQSKRWSGSTALEQCDKCLSSTDTHTVSFTGACLVQAMLLPSVGCGWHCLWLSGAHECSSRCWAPGCSRAGAVSPAAAPQPGTPPPLCCPLHTVGKTSCFKCSKGHVQHITWQKFSNNALLSVYLWNSTRGAKCTVSLDETW